MAGVLASHTDPGVGPDTWVFDTLPADKGVSLGVQVGDFLFETTGNHLWVVGKDHQPIAISA